MARLPAHLSWLKPLPVSLPRLPLQTPLSPWSLQLGLSQVNTCVCPSPAITSSNQSRTAHTPFYRTMVTLLMLPVGLPSPPILPYFRLKLRREEARAPPVRTPIR